MDAATGRQRYITHRQATRTPGGSLRPKIKRAKAFDHGLLPGRTIAIIGHGRSPEGMGWGPRIDDCLVVRMWDCAWQKSEDLGERYDYGFFEAHPSLVQKFMANNRREPRLGWVASILMKTPDGMLPPRTQLVDQTPWNEVGMHLGGRGNTGRLQFTRGTIAALWAMEHLPHGGEVILVGFDNIRIGKTLPIESAFAPIYRKNPGTFSFAGYRGGATKFGNHDYAIERPVMEFMAEHCGVRLTFSQDKWGGHANGTGDW